MNLKKNILVVFTLLLISEQAKAQLRIKTINFVEPNYEIVMGGAETNLVEITNVNFNTINFKKQEFKQSPIRSLNFEKQNNHKVNKTKDNLITKLIRCNLKMSFKVSKNMNLIISYI